MKEFLAFIIGIGIGIPIILIVNFLYRIAIPNGNVEINWIIRILSFLIGFASYYVGLEIVR